MRSRPGFLWLASLAGLAALIPADAARAATILTDHSRDRNTATSLTTGQPNNFNVTSTDPASSDLADLDNVRKATNQDKLAPKLAAVEPGAGTVRESTFVIVITERSGNLDRVFPWRPDGYGYSSSGGPEHAFAQAIPGPSTPVAAFLGLPMLLLFWCRVRRIATAARV